MNHLDLFSGIGGFALAAEWAGFDTVAFCENNAWCVKHALQRNWPDIPIIQDVTKLGKKDLPNTHIDLITAGVPCQPASVAGKRKGIEDARWLWPDTFRIIHNLRPTWVLCENPTGILSLDRGEPFAEILERFRKAGYGTWWETIPASAAGWGHRRERVWVVAYSPRTRLERYSREQHDRDQSRRKQPEKTRYTPPPIIPPLRNSPQWWKNKSPVRPVVNGVSDYAFWKEAITAVGNAIVPQAAYEILQGIQNVESQTPLSPSA